ncbi:unnamed protein product [Anisakis simplex]|uniref:RNase NYN domain-containing protein n=1 Tax=Anisakis simplex TaxID=6269 RepID=A0A3P6PWB5_ANISI|nr:unnamed protein product [Anisakis simplex]
MGSLGLSGRGGGNSGLPVHQKGHVHPDEENKKLSVRGVTIALWYFISRGHQAQALMPFCFKTYPNKSDNWNELMALFRLNLIEFTPGIAFYHNT